MYLNLASDDKRSAVSFDFTKFFSEKGYYVWDGEKKSFVKRNSSHYKQLMKNLVDKYINFDLVDRLKKSPVDILDSWFREALEEELTAPQKEFLQKNYDTFRKMYKLSVETDKFIEKLNSVKTRFNVRKVVSWRLKLGECSCVSTNCFIIVYDKCDGLSEWNIGEDKELDEKDKKIELILRIYEPAVNDSEFMFDVSVKNIKLLNKGFDIGSDKAFVEVGGKMYNLSLIESYLNIKELVEVWQYHDMIILRQSDRDIILMKTTGNKGKPFEVIRLEDYKE